MANKPTLKTPKKKEINKVEDMWRATDLQTERTKLLYFEDLVTSKNPYPLNDMEDMIASIKDHGIEQNLVVKEQRDGTFKIITGHRRYNAIKSIMEADNEGDYQYLSEIYCKVIPLEEDDIITNLRLHETNFENRILLKLPEVDKINIIDDYLFWLKKAKEQKILIKGKPIKGKTRDLLSEKFNISQRTAQGLMNKIKEEKSGERGTSKPIKKEPTSDEMALQSLKKLKALSGVLEGIIPGLSEQRKKQLLEATQNLQDLLS
jgi:ParB-like nuclease domain.